MSEIETLEGTAEEGQRLARAAKDAGLPLLLVGGVAVWVTCPSAAAGRCPGATATPTSSGAARTARRSPRS